MTERKVFQLVHAEARRRAMAAVAEAPHGWRVEVKEPTRSLDQNAMLWPILDAFARQKTWVVNGEATKLTPEEWKDVLTAAWKGETRVAKGVHGGLVVLGVSTSKLGKRAFSEFIEHLLAVAVELGVDVERVEA